MVFPQTGGCLCGAIRYEIVETPTMAYTCHCTHCQRLSASAFSLAIGVAGEAFRLTAGEPKELRRVSDSGNIGTRWVCPECGVWICGGSKPGPTPGTGLRMVRAGTLDDTSWVRPTVHFWTRSAQPWIVFPPGDRVFETQPDDFRGVMVSGMR
jgi:hypothetical protein